VNAHHDVVNFKLPEVPQGKHWNCLVDTNRPDLRENEPIAFGSEFMVTGRSFLLFEAHHEQED